MNSIIINSAIIDFAQLNINAFDTQLAKKEYLTSIARALGLSDHGLIRVIRNDIDAFDAMSFEAKSTLQNAMWYAICKCALHNVRLCYRALERANADVIAA